MVVWLFYEAILLGLLHLVNCFFKLLVQVVGYLQDCVPCQWWSSPKTFYLLPRQIMLFETKSSLLILNLYSELSKPLRFFFGGGVFKVNITLVICSNESRHFPCQIKHPHVKCILCQIFLKRPIFSSFIVKTCKF